VPARASGAGEQELDELEKLGLDAALELEDELDGHELDEELELEDELDAGVHDITAWGRRRDGSSGKSSRSPHNGLSRRRERELGAMEGKKLTAPDVL
jgi:hypothetical protein